MRSRLQAWTLVLLLSLATIGLLMLAGCACRCRPAAADCPHGACPVGMPAGDRPAVDRTVTVPPQPQQPGELIEAPAHPPAGAPMGGSYARAEDIANIGRREVALTGNVVFFEGGFAIGGEAPPSGFTLRTDQYRHLYLRQHGQLEALGVRALENQLVRVTGRVSAIRVGGVETPLRFYPVMDIDSIERVGHRAP